MRFADLDRPPLSFGVVDAALRRSGFWREVRIVDELGSTNDAVAEAARAGAAEGLVVVAEHQTGGRGRLDRDWVSPSRAGLTFSVLLRPPAPALMPLLAGVAYAETLRAHTTVDVGLKWPNDLVVDGRRIGRKLGGLLAEVVGDAVVLGVGINVSTRRDELPRADATSLALETGEPVDRGPLLVALLRGLAKAYAEPGDVLARYRALCTTIGRKVRVSLPDGSELVGVAESVDDDGRLVVAGTAVSAGDVTHVHLR